jgi:hypothetical protein
MATGTVLMPAPRDHVPRVPRTMVHTLQVLSHLETVCREENIVMPMKVRASLAHLRVWLRDVGKQPRP